MRDREPGVLDGTRFFGVVIERDGVSSDDFGDPGDDPAVFPRLDKNNYSYKKNKSLIARFPSEVFFSSSLSLSSLFFGFHSGLEGS